MSHLEGLVQWWERIFLSFGGVIVPLVTLVLGWLAAYVLSLVVRRILHKTQLDDKFLRLVMGEEAASEVRPERFISRIVFYVAMLLVLVGFFQMLGMTALTEPLNVMLNQIFAFMPKLLSAAVLLFIAWVTASVMRRVVRGIIARADLEKRLAEPAGLATPDQSNLPEFIGNAVYWLVFLVVLPAILAALDLQGLLHPVRDMVTEVAIYMPNVLAAGVILFCGWLGARIVQRVVVNLLDASGVNDLADRVGLGQGVGIGLLSRVAGKLSFAGVIVLAAIAALESLNFSTISEPASGMLTNLLGAVPAILFTGAILLVGYLVARFVSRLVDDVLRNVGFNSVVQRLGIAEVSVAEDRTPSVAEATSGDPPAPTQHRATFLLTRPPSQVVGYLAMAAILLFSATEAASQLGFDDLAATLVRLTVLLGNFVLAALIIGFGLYLAAVFSQIVAQRGGVYASLLANIIRAGIVSLSVFMGLKEMGIADQIINLAFGLILGSAAVATAIAFGFGCRDLARSHVEAWVKKIGDHKKD
ncbi:MAG: mechanosensitive ion channel [Gemmatimonadota bacterium]|nr:mechanosensitive ion channel [Gemmatimonadota bacterium]